MCRPFIFQAQHPIARRRQVAGARQRGEQHLHITRLQDQAGGNAVDKGERYSIRYVTLSGICRSSRRHHLGLRYSRRYIRTATGDGIFKIPMRVGAGIPQPGLRSLSGLRAGIRSLFPGPPAARPVTPARRSSRRPTKVQRPALGAGRSAKCFASGHEAPRISRP